jgi:hypothetical protein
MRISSPTLITVRWPHHAHENVSDLTGSRSSRCPAFSSFSDNAFALDRRSRRSASTSRHQADAGSAESAERIHEVRRFWQDYFCNGQLQVFNADTGELLGRKDAYIPLNKRFNPDGAAAELAQWKAEAERRCERERRYGEALQQNALGYDATIELKGAQQPTSDLPEKG